MRKINSKISVLLVVMMLLTVIPTFSLTASAEDETTLSSLRFADTIVFEFAPETTSYTVAVPYNKVMGSYVLPELTYTKTDAAATVAVTGDIDDGLTITVTNGVESKDYTIAFTKVGGNKYNEKNDGSFDTARGSFENNHLDWFGGYTTGWEILKGGENGAFAAYDGDYFCAGTPPVSSQWYYWTGPYYELSVTANKKYIHFLAIRDWGTLTTDASKKVGIWFSDDAGTGTGLYATYKNNSEQIYPLGNVGDNDYNPRAFPITLNDQAWDTYTTVFTAETNSSTYKLIRYAPGYLDTSACTNQRDFALDDYFFGEVVAADIDVTYNGESSIQLAASDTEQNITLTAAAKNQLGTAYGLEGLTPTWSVAGEPEAVTVNDGVVTVAADAAIGTYYVEATYDLGVNSTQGKAKGVYEVKVVGDTSGKLSDLKVNGTEIDLVDGQTAYTFNVPVKYADGAYTYDEPVITAAALKDGEACEISEVTTDAETGAITGTVSVKDGETVKGTYTITFVLVGKNGYNAGSGFEVSADWTADGSWSSVNANDDGAYIPYEGDYYSVGTTISHSGIRQPISLELNKTYIHFLAIRDWGTLNNKANIWIGDFRDGNIYKTYDKNGNSLAAQPLEANVFPITLNDSDWDTYTTVISTASTDGHSETLAPVVRYGPGWQYKTYNAATEINYDFALDAFYYGELTMSDIELEAPYVTASASSQAVALNAKALTALGTNAGLGDKVDYTYALADGAASGVSLANNQLTVPAGYKGAVNVVVTATPNSNWANPAQKNYIKAVAVNFVDNGIYYNRNAWGTKAYVCADTAGTYKFITAEYNDSSLADLNFEEITVTAGAWTPIAINKKFSSFKNFLFEGFTNIKPVTKSGDHIK